jgi:hypothetical protein
MRLLVPALRSPSDDAVVNARGCDDVRMFTREKQHHAPAGGDGGVCLAGRPSLLALGVQSARSNAAGARWCGMMEGSSSAAAARDIEMRSGSRFKLLFQTPVDDSSVASTRA